MNQRQLSGAINIAEVNLWSHVGVLEEERLLGQEFLLDITLWPNLSSVVTDDDILSTADYTIAINGLQKLSFRLNCFTIEFFSEQILNYLEDVYGSIPMEINLRKSSPPIPGFTGNVSIKRSRNK